MNIPRGFTHNSGTRVPEAPHDRRADPPIGPSKAGMIALDTSHGFGRADDANPYYDDPTTNWLLERMRVSLEELANREDPGNVFNVPDSIVIAANGVGVINWQPIPLGSFWYVDRILVQAEPTKQVAVYSSLQDQSATVNPLLTGAGRMRDQGTVDGSGTLVFPTRGTFPLFFTGGEWLSIGISGTAGLTVMCNAQVRQFQR